MQLHSSGIIMKKQNLCYAAYLSPLQDILQHWSIEAAWAASK